MYINEGVRFEGIIKIYGNNNTIEIHKNCVIKGAKFWIEDDKKKIEMGSYSTVEENAEFATIEGCNIIIGEDCMISSEVTIRTGDSHSILNNEGIRINSSQNIKVGNHVWIGNKAVLTKGSLVSDNSIVGSGALVNKVFEIKNCIIAGVLAKVFKEQISWLRERI
ncbi:acyltransferase [Flavobacterium sp. DSR2-3-3]|uniref:acyltransferase n=1 Tax=Flavobacterium sp. DSR2-3-3 TaxID=2804632 RepID=UPI003CE75512